MRSFTGVFITILLILVIISLFLPSLMPLIDGDFQSPAENAVVPLNIFVVLLTDPGVAWMKLLLLLPLGMGWLIFCRL